MLPEASYPTGTLLQNRGLGRRVYEGEWVKSEVSVRGTARKEAEA